MTPSLRLAALLVLPFVVATGATAAEKPYRPLAAEIGAGGPPPADLLTRAEALRAAVEAGSIEEVFAFLAERPRLIVSGLTLGGRRRVETAGPFADAAAALAAIGAVYTEGEPIVADGRPVDFGKARAATALRTIGERLDAAKWGRDPLVPGGWCTSRGVRWDAKAAKKAGLEERRGAYVTAPTRVRARAEEAAPVLATLKPGVLYAYDQDGEDGWSGLALPNGEIGWARSDRIGDPVPWGLCLEKRGAAGWLVTTFVSALN